MTNANDAREVAQNMLAARGRKETLDRLNRYIAGDIRSEKGEEFWRAVKAIVNER